MSMNEEVNSLVTNGIRINTWTTYVIDQSSPQLSNYVFAYRIQIINESEYTVQLISRFWQITDGWGEERYVEGEGVVGQKPVLHPGMEHTYVSGCAFRTPFGMMKGYYNMVRLKDGFEFPVEIPAFILQVPYLLN